MSDDSKHLYIYVSPYKRSLQTDNYAVLLYKLQADENVNLCHKNKHILSEIIARVLSN